MSAAASRVLLSRAPARRTTLRSAVAAASGARTLATAPPPAPKPTTRLPARKRGKDDVLRPEEHERTWLARYIDGRPAARDAFLRVARAFGHGSPKQRAVRRTLGLYEVLCAGRAEEEAAFWRDRA
jgi:cytochrome b pre-mRNA-processing protein 3